MAKPKVRADGRVLAEQLVAAGVDLAALPTDDDGWHSHASLSRVVAARFQTGPQRPAGAPTTAVPSMTPQQAYDSDRITAKSLASWEQRYNADTAGIGQVLASLTPVPGVNDDDPHRVAASAGHGSSSGAAGYARPRSRVEELEERIFGPTAERRELLEVEQAERELAEIEAAEAEQVAAMALTDDEYRALFPPTEEH